MNTATRTQIGKIDPRLIEQAKAVSIIDLARQVTTLHRESSQEWAGPCPKCGGDDRFHCTTEWFFCRQCHPERGDSIEYRHCYHGDRFKEAVERLTNGGIPTATTAQRRAEPQPKRKAGQTDQWRHEAAQIHARAKELLWGKEGAPARAYLEGRGLVDPKVWERFELGYRPDTPLANTRRQPQYAPAIAMPWMPGGKLCAVRYRYLQVQHYTDDNGDNRTEKLWSQPGSTTSGRLFGGQLLFGCAERFRTLVLVEGELNAMSIWQASYETGIDVLSIGSQSASLPAKMIEYAQRYSRVMVWADEEGPARKLMGMIPGAIPIKSPGGKDANDLLGSGLLGGFLAMKRENNVKSQDELEGLLWALFDAAMLPAGIDSGSAAVLRRIATNLCRKAEIYEAEPNRWITPLVD
jgi:hypothetical protein